MYGRNGCRYISVSLRLKWRPRGLDVEHLLLGLWVYRYVIYVFEYSSTSFMVLGIALRLLYLYTSFIDLSLDT